MRSVLGLRLQLHAVDASVASGLEVTAGCADDPNGNGGLSRFEEAERIAEVRAVLERIPPRDRQLLLMREEGFKYEEIARVIGVAPASVGTLIARALKRFTEAYSVREEADESRS